MNKRKYKYELTRVKKKYIASTSVNIKVYSVNIKVYSVNIKVYSFAAKIITHQSIAVKHTFNFTSDSC